MTYKMSSEQIIIAKLVAGVELKDLEKEHAVALYDQFKQSQKNQNQKQFRILYTSFNGGRGFTTI